MRPLAPNTDKGRTVTRSISDDDACATCAHCVYQPGEQSDCAQGWPATPDADGYITECNQLIDLEYSAIWLQLTAA